MLDLLEGEFRFGDGGRGFPCGVGDLVDHFIGREGVNLVQDGGEFHLDLGETGGEGRHDRVFALVGEGLDLLLRVVVEIHIHRTGEQASRFQGGAKAVTDTFLQAGKLLLGGDFLAGRAQKPGVQFHKDRHFLVIGFLYEIEGNARDPPDAYSAVFHGCGNAQTPDTLVEEEQHLESRLKGGGGGILGVVVEFENGTVADHLTGFLVFIHREGNPTGYHRLEGWRADFESINASRHIDTTGVPELRVCSDQRLVFLPDERLVNDAPPVGIQDAAFDPAHIVSTVINR